MIYSTKRPIWRILPCYMLSPTVTIQGNTLQKLYFTSWRQLIARQSGPLETHKELARVTIKQQTKCVNKTHPHHSHRYRVCTIKLNYYEDQQVINMWTTYDAQGNAQHRSYDRLQLYINPSNRFIQHQSRSLWMIIVSPDFNINITSVSTSLPNSYSHARQQLENLTTQSSCAKKTPTDI